MNRCRIAFLAVMTFTVCLQTGCTADMWRQANRDTITYWHVDGILRPSPERLDAQRQLIVEYAGDGVNSNFFAVPLDAAGSPPPPLLYPGNRMTIRKIEADLTPSQLDAIVSHVFGDQSKADGELAIHSHGYATFVPKAGSAADPQFFDYIKVPHQADAGVSVVAVVLGPDGVPLNGRIHGQDFVVPAGCRVLLLPSEQPRLAADRKIATVRGALLTPPMFVAEIILTPVAIAWRFLSGMGR